MKFTIVTTSIKGGAGYSAHNLYLGLQAIKANPGLVTLSVLQQWRNKWYHRLKRWWMVRKYLNRNYQIVENAPEYDYFTFARTGYQDVQQHPLIEQADVLNLHWINNMVDYPTFFSDLNKPVIWTLHDTAAFTGGCHYTFGCQQYLIGCNSCMQLADDVKNVGARQIFETKVTAISKLDPATTVVVSPSLWLKSLSETSALLGRFQHYHIPYGIDTSVFKPTDKTAARKMLGLGLDKFVVLFVGTSLTQPRKGFDVILRLKDQLQHSPEIIFAAVGGGNDEVPGILNLGYLTEKETIAVAYNAADVFIIPSRQDNLPNTMLEALCCGTPVIGHQVGGIPDAVQHGVNGYLVEPENIEAMQLYVEEMLCNKDMFIRQNIAALAHQKYALHLQAEAYQKLAEQLAGS